MRILPRCPVQAQAYPSPTAAPGRRMRCPRPRAHPQDTRPGLLAPREGRAGGRTGKGACGGGRQAVAAPNTQLQAQAQARGAAWDALSAALPLFPTCHRPLVLRLQARSFLLPAPQPHQPVGAPGEAKPAGGGHRIYSSLVRLRTARRAREGARQRHFLHRPLCPQMPACGPPAAKHHTRTHGHPAHLAHPNHRAALGVHGVHRARQGSHQQARGAGRRRRCPGQGGLKVHAGEHLAHWHAGRRGRGGGHGEGHSWQQRQAGRQAGGQAPTARAGQGAAAVRAARRRHPRHGHRQPMQLAVFEPARGRRARPGLVRHCTASSGRTCARPTPPRTPRCAWAARCHACHTCLSARPPCPPTPAPTLHLYSRTLFLPQLASWSAQPGRKRRALTLWSDGRRASSRARAHTISHVALT